MTVTNIGTLGVCGQGRTVYAAIYSNLNGAGFAIPEKDNNSATKQTKHRTVEPAAAGSGNYYRKHR